MSEFKNIKFLIGDDPELSAKIQNHLFDAGYKWVTGRTDIRRTESKILFLIDGTIRGEMYHADGSEEKINIDWMRTKKPETIELGGKTYIKAELEEALKHIKPVE